MPTAAASFDVASIRPSAPDNTGFSVRPNPNNFQVSGATLDYLVQYAYDVENYQVKGGPGWAGTARFDITAKADPALSLASTSKNREERDVILQARLTTLLAERFSLKAHQETKELPGYALVAAKGGLKLLPPKPGGGYSFTQSSITCNDFPPSELASLLSTFVGRTVSDRTHDSRHYSFTLKWSPDDRTVVEGAPPTLFTAIQEQLGLKLEASKEPTRIIIIDSAARPSPN